MASDKSKILKSAEKFVATGKTAQAIEEYLKVLKDNPKEWNVRIQVGDLYLKLNKTLEAIEQFQHVADHYHTDGFFLKAIAIYKRINKLDPTLTDICIKLSDLYLKQGLTMDAKSQLQIVAQHYLNKNQSKNAITTLKKLIEIEPENLKTRNDLAKAYKAEGMVPEAIKEYLEISEDLLRKNLLKESLAVLDTAYKLDPRATEILERILAIYAEQNETAKAAALLEEALKIDPSNPYLLAMVARDHSAHNDFEKAHETIDRAIGGSGRKEPFWAVKGDLYLKSGDLPRAFSQYLMVVEKQVQRKELEKAIELLQKVTRSDATFYPAWLRLADLYSMLRQQNNVISTYGSLVDAYIAKSLYQEAGKYVKKLIEFEPDDIQHQQKLEFINSFLEKSKTDVKLPEAELKIEPSKEDLDISVLENSELISAARTSVPSGGRAAPKPPTAALRTPIAPIQPSVSSETEAEFATLSEEDNDFVSEHLIEAEVFNKYGLIDKALEQVQFVINKYPNWVQAHQKLKEIYLEKGERDKAVEECVAMSRILRKQGDTDQAEDILSEARQINPNHALLEKAYKEIPAAGKGADVLGEIEKLAQNIKTKSSAMKVPPALRKEKASPDSILSQLFDSATKSSRPSSVTKSSPTIKVQKPAPPRVETPPPVPEEIELEIVEFRQEPKPGAALSEDEFEEIDFYTAQGLKAEAKKLLLELREKYPDDAGVLKRLNEMEKEPVSAHKKSEIAKEIAPSSDEEIVINLDEFDVSPMEQEIGAKQSTPVETSEEELEVALQGGAPEPAAEVTVPELEIDIPVSTEEPLVSSKASTEETWDLSDLASTAQALQSMKPAETLEQIDIDMDMLDMPTEPAEAIGEARSEPEAAVEIDLGPTEFAELEDSGPIETQEEIREKVTSKTEQLPTEAPVAAMEDDNRIYGEAMDAVFSRQESQQETETAPVSVKAPEELFEEDEFFDLAAELEEGFLNVQSAVEEERPPDGQNYSLEEILSDFRKGVEKQLGAEDYDTRYNLGIAYKEMGLIDEAIAEFQVASKDPKKFLECCSMLGLCFVEKGMHKLAIKWYQRGLDTAGYSEDEYVGLRFDLAQAHEAMGELQRALEIYQEVYGLNANYRNVTKKIKELQDQLKKK